MSSCCCLRTTLICLLGLSIGSGNLAAADEASPKQALLKKMNTIVIPKLDFEQAKLADVFAFIRTRSEELSLDGKGINLFLKVKPEALESRVTMTLDEIPLGEAIRYICMGTDLNYKVEPYAVIIYDAAGQKEEMETRIYPIGGEANPFK